MIYGYARVSTREQNLDRQFESLERYVDKENIYFDKQSGKDMNRKQYQELKKAVKKGDEIYFHELDRLGRNKEEMIREIKSFKENGVVVRILDVPTTMVKIEGQEWVVEMINNILIEVLSSVAENERKKIRNRQQEGIKIALENDVIVTNPPFSHISNRLYDFVKNNNLKFAYIMPHCSLGYSKWLKEYNERKIKYIKIINRIFTTPENKRVKLGILVCNNLGIDKYRARKKDTKRTYKDLKIEDEIIRCYDSSRVIGSLDALPDKFLAPITTMLCRQDLLEKYEVSLYNQLKKYYPKIFRRVIYTKREKKA